MAVLAITSGTKIAIAETTAWTVWLPSDAQQSLNAHWTAKTPLVHAIIVVMEAHTAVHHHLCHHIIHAMICATRLNQIATVTAMVVMIKVAQKSAPKNAKPQ